MSKKKQLFELLKDLSKNILLHSWIPGDIPLQMSNGIPVRFLVELAEEVPGKCLYEFLKKPLKELLKQSLVLFSNEVLKSQTNVCERILQEVLEGVSKLTPEDFLKES